MTIDFGTVEFALGAYALGQLPPPDLPEIAFAGRSNVGKSSLINRLVNRRHLVKVSSQPGKTRGLNFFMVGNALYLVDLPGYGYAKVPMAVRESWRGLISEYLETRKNLCGVVVILDIRHPVKALDLELITWLKGLSLPCLPVYTKLDKLNRGERQRQAALLDAGLTLRPDERILFSSQTGEGREELIAKLTELYQPRPDAGPHHEVR